MVSLEKVKEAHKKALELAAVTVTGCQKQKEFANDQALKFAETKCKNDSVDKIPKGAKGFIYSYTYNYGTARFPRYTTIWRDCDLKYVKKFTEKSIITPIRVSKDDFVGWYK